MSFNPKNLIFLLFVSCLLLLVAFCNAAEISLESETKEIAVGQQFQVDILLNTEDEEINAVEGKVIFLSDILELKEIRDANSVINFWVEKPKVEAERQIIFSGITPGGYKGERGLLFSLIFFSKKEGEGTVEIQEARALLNDGKGTEAQLSLLPYQFRVSQEFPAQPIVSPIDKEPPELFLPEIARDPTVFDGKWFLVFATQDKGSGIDYYEILEKGQKGSFQSLIQKEKWEIGKSPYLLKDQKLKSYIYVKAVDKAGNERIATLPPQKALSWYENYLIWSIIFIIITLAIIVWYTVKKSKFKIQISK